MGTQDVMKVIRGHKYWRIYRWEEVSKTISENRWKDEKERNERNGTKRRDRVLLIAKRKGLGFIDLSGRGDRRHINLSL